MNGLETHKKRPDLLPWPRNQAALRARLAEMVDEGLLHPDCVRPVASKTAHRIENLALGFLSAVLGRLPEKISCQLMRWGMRQVGRLARRRNRQITANLSAAFPERSAEDIQGILADVWRGVGQSLYELSAYPRLRGRIAERVVLSGLEIIEELQAVKKPIMILAAHQANWELIFDALVPSIGPITYIYAAQTNPEQDMIALYRRLQDGDKRSRGYPRTLEDAPARLARDMAEGRPLLIGLDQALPGPEIDFFGRPAHTATGPIRIAEATGAALVPVEMRRGPKPGSLHLEFLTPLTTHKDGAPLDKAIVMAEYNSVLEASIAKDPSNWFWLHNRWKTIRRKKQQPKLT